MLFNFNYFQTIFTFSKTYTTLGWKIKGLWVANLDSDYKADGILPLKYKRNLTQGLCKEQREANFYIFIIKKTFSP